MNRLLKTGMASALMIGALAGCTNPNDPGQRAAGGALFDPVDQDTDRRRVIGHRNGMRKAVNHSRTLASKGRV